MYFGLRNNTSLYLHSRRRNRKRWACAGGGVCVCIRVGTILVNRFLPISVRTSFSRLRFAETPAMAIKRLRYYKFSARLNSSFEILRQVGRPVYTAGYGYSRKQTSSYSREF